jgi:amphi-Trp domain-containing protein
VKTNEVKLKRKMDADAVGMLLSDLVGAFRQGTVCIQEGAGFVTLNPAGEIQVEIAAGGKKGKQKIEIELSWEEAPAVASVEELPIRISAEEPEFTAPRPEEAETDE